MTETFKTEPHLVLAMLAGPLLGFRIAIIGLGLMSAWVAMPSFNLFLDVPLIILVIGLRICISKPVVNRCDRCVTLFVLAIFAGLTALGTLAFSFIDRQYV